MGQESKCEGAIRDSIDVTGFVLVWGDTGFGLVKSSDTLFGLVKDALGFA